MPVSVRESVQEEDDDLSLDISPPPTSTTPTNNRRFIAMPISEGPEISPSPVVSATPTNSRCFITSIPASIKEDDSEPEEVPVHPANTTSRRRFIPSMPVSVKEDDDDDFVPSAASHAEPRSSTEIGVNSVRGRPAAPEPSDGLPPLPIVSNPRKPRRFVTSVPVSVIETTLEDESIVQEEEEISTTVNGVSPNSRRLVIPVPVSIKEDQDEDEDRSVPLLPPTLIVVSPTTTRHSVPVINTDVPSIQAPPSPSAMSGGATDDESIFTEPPPATSPATSVGSLLPPSLPEHITIKAALNQTIVMVRVKSSSPFDEVRRKIKDKILASQDDASVKLSESFMLAITLASPMRPTILRGGGALGGVPQMRLIVTQADWDKALEGLKGENSGHGRSGAKISVRILDTLST